MSIKKVTPGTKDNFEQDWRNSERVIIAKHDLTDLNDELEDVSAELREFDDFTSQQLYDLEGAAKSLAFAINKVTTNVTDTHERLFEKVRNIKNILEKINSTKEKA